MNQIVEHHSWNIKDSSKIDEFISCQRKYFYHYILGWVLDVPAHDLYFGECWHKAREYQLCNGYDDIEGAYGSFITHYRKEFNPSTDVIYVPKNPTGVLNALRQFATYYPNDLINNEVMVIDGQKMLEISGTVPVDEKRVLHYRMDSIMRRLEDGMIFSWDHKTTSEKYIIGRQWQDQFALSIQNGTYTHCLYCMFPIEQVLGVEFCGVGFNYLKKGSANRPAGYYATLQRVPAFKSPDQMNVWLWTVNHYLNNIEREMDYLSHCSESDDVLMAFPINPKDCTSYRGCPYYDYCLSWSNPLRKCYEPPLGFTQKFWDPSEKESNVKKDLTWKG
jgi:hypothetical protein